MVTVLLSFYVFALAMIVTVSSQSCDDTQCAQVCDYFHLKGSCKSGACDCTLGKGCHDMEPACQLACKAFNLDGECDESDQCVCKASPEICSPAECEEPCIEDRPPECIFVAPLACLEYGPFEFCTCACFTAPRRNNSVNGYRRNKKVFFADKKVKSNDTSFYSRQQMIEALRHYWYKIEPKCNQANFENIL